MITEKMLRELTSRGNSVRTPLYIVNQDNLRENICLLRKALESRFDRFVIGYSNKTNGADPVLQTVAECGAWAEVVSHKEYFQALKYFDPGHIIYNGVIPDFFGKFLVLESGGIVNIENLTELEAVNRKAEELGRVLRLGIRINVSLEGHPASRFGIRVTDEILNTIRSMNNIIVNGIHCHITKSRDLESWSEKSYKMAEIAKLLDVDYIDLGGNMYGPMCSSVKKRYDNVPSFQDYADCIYRSMHQVFGDNIPCIVVEPGTAIVANAQSYVSRILDIKSIAGRSLVTLDGKGSDVETFVNPADRFPYIIISRSGNYIENATVYGCTCTEFDIFISSCSGRMGVGDLIAFDNVGAYSNSLAPDFIQPYPPFESFSDNAGFK